MKTYKFTQFGTFSVSVLLPLLAFILALLLFSPKSDNAFIVIMTLLCLVLIMCILAFYKLSININESEITFRLGIGFIKKSYPLINIEYCKPVKNSPWYGIGIRITPDGWLYNVSGLYAIELGFKNKKRIRIGTDKPEEISQIINKIINKSYSDLIIDTSHRSYKLFVVFTLLIGLILPATLIIFGTLDTNLECHDSFIKIKGMYGMSIKYSDITRIDTLNSLPRIKIRTNGFAFGKVLKGHFRLYDKSNVKIFIKKGIAPYIYIKTNEDDLYLNFNKSETTRAVYQKINTMMKN
jgi:hypothetical protein